MGNSPASTPSRGPVITLNYMPNLEPVRPRPLNLTVGQLGTFSTDTSVNARLPMMVDLRTHHKMPPVYDQGSVGSCTAPGPPPLSRGGPPLNALCAAFAFAYPYLGFVGSRLFVYYNERRLDQTLDEDVGSTLTQGIRTFEAAGAPRPWGRARARKVRRL